MAGWRKSRPEDGAGVRLGFSHQGRGWTAALRGSLGPPLAADDGGWRAAHRCRGGGDPVAPDSVRIPAGRTDRGIKFRGGCTLLLDREYETDPIRYAIVRPVWSQRGEAMRDAMLAKAAGGPRALYGTETVNDVAEPFAVMHRHLRPPTPTAPARGGLIRSWHAEHGRRAWRRVPRSRRTRRRRTRHAAPPASEARAGVRVRVRMYRQGLGDCFLLSLPGAAGREFHVMVDCGVILGTPDAADRLRLVLDDVIRTTGGRVDVLVVTHEHYDHVAAFAAVPGQVRRRRQAASPASCRSARYGSPGPRIRRQACRATARAAAAAQGGSGRTARPAGRDGSGVGRCRGGRRGRAAILRYRRRRGGQHRREAGRHGTGDGERSRLGCPARDNLLAARRDVGIARRARHPGLCARPARDPTAFGKSDAATEVYHLDAGPLEEAVRMGAASTATGGPDRYAPFDRFYRHPLSAAATGRAVDAATTSWPSTISASHLRPPRRISRGGGSTARGWGAPSNSPWRSMARRTTRAWCWPSSW